MKRETKKYVTEINKTIEKAAKANEKIFTIFLEAFTALDDEDFKVFYDAVKYEESSKRKLRAICKNQIIVKHLDSLPKSWGTLYEMSKIDDSTLENLIADGTISCTTTSKDITEIREKNGTVKTCSKGENKNSIVKSQNNKPFTITCNLKEGRDIDEVINSEDYKRAIEILSELFDIEHLFPRSDEFEEVA